MAERLPSRTRVVVVGGGIVGCSIAYHLTKLGIADVVLLERKRLTSGTTWHAAGLLGQLRPSENQTAMVRYAVRLFRDIEDETGQATGFRQSGDVSLALDASRLELLRREVAYAHYLGMAEARMVAAAELAELWPVLNLDGIAGASYLPSNAQVDPVGAAMALAKGARSGGAQIFENVAVRDILAKGERVLGVATEAGEIAAETVVLACGMWTRELAAKVGVKVPLHAAEHFYVVTEAIPGLPKLPSIFCPEERSYYKEDAGKLLVGAFEAEGVPWGSDGIPEAFEFESLPADHERYAEFLVQATHRVPVLARTGIRTFFVGPESFTPDARALIGPAPGFPNLFVAAGFCSLGIMSSPGAGRIIAEWIRQGEAPFSLEGRDLRRMMPFQGTRRYLFDRTRESLGLLADMPWPGKQLRTARSVRRLALHSELLDAGAEMGERSGWEAPLFFASATARAAIRPRLGRQDWYPIVAAECRATRDAVAFYDQSNFAKFLVQGRDAARVLNWVSANDVDVAPGRVVYTQWLNPRGGIETDLTVNRLAEETYLVVTAPSSQIRDLDWLRRHAPEGAHVTFADVTSAFQMFGVMGPKSRELLKGLTDADLANPAFPFAASREIDLGYALVRATRLTYVGELGWELLVPTEMAGHVYARLRAAGAALGLRHAGLYAMDACRLERGYRDFGHDLTEDDTPLEAGLGFAVAWEKPHGFLGRDALMRQREAGALPRRLVQIRLSDRSEAAPILVHNEPIWRDGVRVGVVTSGGWGFALEASLGMGYLHHPAGVTAEWIAAGRYEVEVALERFPATVQLKPFYDPTGARVRM